MHAQGTHTCQVFKKKKKPIITCLNEVAIQSQPVSPPPMTTMSLSLANRFKSVGPPNCFF